MILSPEVLTILILDFMFILFSSIAFYLSIEISKSWDIESNSQLQYVLEKRSFLVATIIKFIFFIKIPLFLFFIFTLDKISNVLTGAMCAAGVLDATEFGNHLMVFKILNIYLFAFWLVLNSTDLKNKIQPYTRIKFILFIIIYFLLIFEIYLELDMFLSFEIDKLVSCCGSLYSSTSNSFVSKLFNIDTHLIVISFYITFLLLIVFYFLQNRYLYLISNLLFIITSIFSLILFFGTYIYQLPSHHCPFCYLQSDYNYIGYLLYVILFLGTFYGLIVAFNDNKKFYNRSIALNTIYVVIVSLYVVVYYLRNGVFL